MATVPWSARWLTRKGVAYFAGALLLQLVAVETVGWIRRHDEFGGAAALLVYLVLAGGSWLAVSTQLPHRDVRWPGLIPGALLFGAGLLCVNVFNVYVTTRLLEGREDTYGALGVAAAVLFSLVLVGRLFVLSAELNARFTNGVHETRTLIRSNNVTRISALPGARSTHPPPRRARFPHEPRRRLGRWTGRGPSPRRSAPRRGERTGQTPARRTPRGCLRPRRACSSTVSSTGTATSSMRPAP